jgi:uncharacterized coiled-coil protein SlyX
MRGKVSVDLREAEAIRNYRDVYSRDDYLTASRHGLSGLTVELGARELLTFGTVLVGLASGWAMIKTQLAHAQKTITKLSRLLQNIESRMDSVESDKNVAQSQLGTITSILAPANLKKMSERDGAIEERLKSLERETASQRSMHNDTHPKVE